MPFIVCCDYANLDKFLNQIKLIWINFQIELLRNWHLTSEAVQLQ